MIGVRPIRRQSALLINQSYLTGNQLKLSQQQGNRIIFKDKRYSLDSQPVQQKVNLPENSEEIEHYKQKQGEGKEKLIVIKGEKVLKPKYYWKQKTNKSGKTKNSSNKPKHAISQLMTKQSKSKRKSCSKSKEKQRQNYTPVDRLIKGNRDKKNHSKNDNVIISDGCLTKQSPDQRVGLKKAQSMLNSTMITKRQSQEPKPPQSKPYEEVLFKLTNILGRYQRRIMQLRAQKQHYRLKWRQQKKK